MLHQDSFIETHSARAVESDYSNGLLSSRSQGLALQQQLQQLEEIIVLDGLKMPMTRRTLVDEEKLLAQLLAVERSIPETVQAAESILQNRDEILARAQKYAQDTIESAQKRAAQIADELTIIQQAEKEAQRLRQQVQDEVDVIRQRSVSEIERVRRQTQQEIDAMRHAAQAECEQIQRDSDCYADQTLKDLEARLSHILNVIQNGRLHLQQRS
jgi:F0F1-type ATP synthase membrane subunit b/b'